MIRVLVTGATGKMGRRVIDLMHADPELELVGAVTHRTHAALGRDAGEVAGRGSGLAGHDAANVHRLLLDAHGFYLRMRRARQCLPAEAGRARTTGALLYFAGTWRMGLASEPGPGSGTGLGILSATKRGTIWSAMATA